MRGEASPGVLEARADLHETAPDFRPVGVPGHDADDAGLEHLWGGQLRAPHRPLLYPRDVDGPQVECRLHRHLLGGRVEALRGVPDRSEEHTSELQSLTNLVCRLLLEKK